MKPLSIGNWIKSEVLQGNIMAQPRTIQNSMLMGICIGAFGGGLYAYMMLTGIGDFIDQESDLRLIKYKATSFGIAASGGFVLGLYLFLSVTARIGRFVRGGTDHPESPSQTIVVQTGVSPTVAETEVPASVSSVDDLLNT